MTRKRFIKMVMSSGKNRNTAVALAYARPRDMSYGEYYWLCGIAWDTTWGRLAAEAAASALKQFSAMAIEAAMSVNDAIGAFSILRQWPEKLCYKKEEKL